MHQLLRVSTTVVSVAFSVLSWAAFAQTQEKTAGGILYATGAVTAEELQALESDKGKYKLWVTTAAKGSGAYLSDATVRISDVKKNVVLDTMVVGPWLFVDLPPGVYSVEATFEGQTQRRTARVGTADHPHQVIVYFDTPANVSPEWVSPFKESPYATE